MVGFAFVLCWIVHMLQGVMGWGVVLLAFAPFLAVNLLEGKRVVWWAMAAGLCVDLVANDPMGVHAINYVSVCGLLSGMRKRWSWQQPLHLVVYTAMISWASTILQAVLLFLFDRRVPIFGKWALVDIFCMPVVDGAYALVWLFGPLLLWQKFRYKWVLYWSKKNSLFRASR